ncbi:hypothetical protein OEZ85_002524 [Tetradesmus obliquus]|uniref:Phosphoribosyltransferase domain-containing protein n=1 Tax=Tetradesmus obliquus TaxID=3088 RepID=A0ABY8TYA6_TETOB|nr:hypothetical protein OEZ85_002524 [Tetradesmus obliquus]
MAQATISVAPAVTDKSEQLCAAAASAATYSIHDDVGEVLFTKQQMAEKVVEMGKLLGKTYEGKAPVLMPILKGGFIFAADLIRALDPCPEDLVVEFVSARSYGARTETSGTVQVSFDAEAVAGRHCLMVDDLCDSGLTLLTVRDQLLAAGAASVASVVLLDKRARRKVSYDPDFVCLDCPNQWVAGMGMDTNQRYRSMDYVAVLKPEAIQKAMHSA